jgi:signal transduction histidine kinase
MLAASNHTASNERLTTSAGGHTVFSVPRILVSRDRRPARTKSGRGRLTLPLTLKFSLLITGLVVLTVALVSVFLLRQQQHALTTEMTKRGRTIAENLAAGAKASLVTNDHLSLNVLVKDAMQDPDVAYIVIADQDGKVQAHSDVSLMGNAVERPPGLPALGNQIAISTYDSQAHGRIIDVAVPLAFSQVPVGALYLGFSQQSMDATLTRTRNQTILIAALMVLLGVLGALALARVFSRPIFLLVDGTRAIAAGNFDIALPVRSRDEVGILTESFNQMALSLSEKARIEEERRQFESASRHKSEFLANMSHELRTPLNAIIGFSEVLLERMFGDLNEKQEEYLRDILASGRHLLSLINDILDLSKIEAGRMELELAAFPLPTTLENARTLVRERAARHGITLELMVDPDVGDIVADERKLKQVLLNLLSNAVKFTPAGGRIDLGAALRDDVVEISVSDTGVGIAKEDQEAVFEEFRQVGTDYTRKHEGTGLGLTLTKKLVELHGGRIRLDSEVGRGSVFTFALPLRPRVAVPEASSA